MNESNTTAMFHVALDVTGKLQPNVSFLLKSHSSSKSGLFVAKSFFPGIICPLQRGQLRPFALDAIIVSHS